MSGAAANKRKEPENARSQDATPKKRGREAKPELVLYSTDMRRAPSEGPTTCVTTWNVASLRSLLKNEPQAVRALVEQERADVLCLQETKLKASDEVVAEAQLQATLPSWRFYWNSSTARKGYSGVGLASRVKPLKVTYGLGIEEHDTEGRLITAEYQTHYVICVYVPNAGQGLKRIDYRLQSWDVAFAAYLTGLLAKKPVIIAGDLNCAHTELDIHNPRSNLKSPGFTPEERESFGRLLLGTCGFVDAFRARHPGVTAYTYWDHKTRARERNSGWRLDYCLVSEALAARVHDCFHLPDTMGSDHCPVGIVLQKPLDGALPVAGPAAAATAEATATAVAVPPGGGEPVMKTATAVAVAVADPAVAAQALA
ncbi:hypothetical protein WJX81_007950 [Elliptochloris bilobata]|uniref:DNA-(apurinic or apyrimidinic site) endonuclease n=1 Tax=Elliptochloris bilobata TaxID=381761 RepID=A0AAW1SI33_9CHLO